MSKVRDRFETALKLSAKTEGVTLPDVREELRPKTASEVRDLEWTRKQARAAIGELCADERIGQAVDRLLGYCTTVDPNDLDFAILAEMDDTDIGTYAWRADLRDRLTVLRGAIRRRG